MFHIIPCTCPMQITCIESPKYISLSLQPRCMRAFIPNMSLNPLPLQSDKKFNLFSGYDNRE